MYPRLIESQRYSLVTDNFLGYVHKAKIADGAWWDMMNLTGDERPLMATRKARGAVAQLTAPHGIIAKDALAWIDGTRLFYDGLECTFNPGVGLSEAEAMLPKRVVGMGAYICVFPDCVYYNTVDPTDNGYMFARFDADGLAEVRFDMCTADGNQYTDVTVSETEPDSPENGDYWLDVGSETHALKQYSAQMQTWVTIPTVYTRIASAGVHAGFSVGDGVDISGVHYAGIDERVAEQAEELNGAHIISAMGEGWIAVAGMIEESFTQSGGLTVARSVPAMDFVVESNNRLWGCRYGMVNGEAVNELYACKLGDFKNWSCYQGISTDSYRVSLGSDGQFTGAISYQGYPTFFKEGAIHRVYGNMPSNFQVVTQEFRGVQKGSAGSLAIVGQTLYYLSKTDICSYDGSAPLNVGDPLGDEKYKNAVAGTWGTKYVISAQDDMDAWHLFVYDNGSGMWTREDDTQMRFTAQLGGELYWIDSAGRLIAMCGSEGVPESAVPWEAVSGLQTWEYKNHKRLGRYNIRCQIAQGATLTAYFEYDSSGTWEEAGTVTGTGITRTVHFFVIPHRCDHLRMKLTGTDRVRIFSIARLLEEASDL